MRRSIEGAGTALVRALALAITIASLPALGCDTTGGAKSALGYTADAKRAYEDALLEFNAHNWLDAQTLFREVKRKYSYSKYARLSELRLADADFAQEKYADAIRQYRQFVHDHRSDADEVSYARSRIAEAQYKEIGDSFILAAPEERDQAVIVDTYKELRNYLHDYPDAPESAHIRLLLADVTARLVRHELYVARFYLQKDNYEAAVARIQYALKNFATVGSINSGLEPDALLLLGETYLKMHRWIEARESFVAILRQHAASPLTVQARGYLEFMRERGV
jgi:outer membrane protein assembly factor BamD